MKATDLTLLYPSNPLKSNYPDPDYEEEYQIANGMTNVRLLDLDLLLNQGILRLNQTLPPSTIIVYRGWMLIPEKYSLLQSLIEHKNAALLT
ncbi:hypothetical protein CHT97_06985, partial [Lacticaseibacillus chiayiensis]